MKSKLYYIVCLCLILSCSPNEICLSSNNLQNFCPTEDLDIGIEYKNPFFENPLNNFALYINTWQWYIAKDTLKVYSCFASDDEASTINMFKFLITENCISPIINKSYIIETLGIFNEDTFEWTPLVIEREEKDFLFIIQSYSKNNYLIGQVQYMNVNNNSINIYIELANYNHFENLLE